MKEKEKDEQWLADVLHKKQCRLDHTERCDWYYRDWAHLGDKEASKNVLSLMIQRELTIQSLGWKLKETEDGFTKLVKINE